MIPQQLKKFHYFFITKVRLRKIFKVKIKKSVRLNFIMTTPKNYDKGENWSLIF